MVWGRGEMAYATDLRSVIERYVGSSPTAPTMEEYQNGFKLVVNKMNHQFLYDKGELFVGPDNLWRENLSVTDAFLHNATGKPWFIQDGPFIYIKGKDASICYELLEQSPMMLTWWARKVKYIPNAKME